MQKYLLAVLLLSLQSLFSQETWIPFKEKAKWGWIDLNGKTMIAAQFYKVTPFHQGVAGASVADEKWGLIDRGGKWIFSPRARQVRVTAMGAIAETTDSTYIYDASGRLLFASDYYALWMTDKSICFQGNNIDYFLTDLKGNRLQDKYARDAQKPSEKMLAMKLAEDKWSYFYETGNLAFKGVFYDAMPFKEGMAGVADPEGMERLWGFINYQGIEVIPYKYENVSSFSQGLARVQKDGLYGYIDKTGRDIVPCQYFGAKDFHQGYARVQKTDKWTYINVSGQEVGTGLYDYTLDFSENMGVVMQGDKWGAIDENGKLIIPFIYDRIYSFKEGFAAAMKDGKSGYLNKKGEVAIPFIYDLCYDFEKGLAKVRKEGLYGYINATGITQVPITFYNLGVEAQELVGINVPERWGFIDSEGNTKIPFIYDRVSAFHNGRAMVNFNRNIGYIDKKGKWIAPPIYVEGMEFKENVAYVGLNVDQGGDFGHSLRYNYIDTTGTRLTDKLYNSASEYASNGMVVVEKESGNALLTTKGKEIRLSIEYDVIMPFQQGTAIVKLMQKYGLIDKQGVEVLPCEYNYIGDFNEGFYRIFVGEVPELDDDVRLKPNTFIGKWGFVDGNGKMILEPQYDFVLPFQNGYAKVQDKGKWGFVDKTGKLVIPCTYEQLWNVVEGVARFKSNRKFGVIDITGKVVIPANYSELWEASEGLIVAAHEEKYGFLDLAGKTIIPFDYEDAQYFSEGKAAVMKQGKWGVIDKTGKTIVPFIYEEISPYKNGLAKVSSAQKLGCIDAKGNIVIPIIYTAMTPFHHGVAKVSKGDYFQLINDKGKLLSPLILEFETNTSENKAMTWSEGLVGMHSISYSGYENEQKEEIIPAIYEATNNEYANTIYVKKNGKAFALDAAGRYLINPSLYDDYNYTGNEDTFVFKKEGLYYMIDRNGTPILPTSFESHISFSEGLANAKKNGKWGYINTKGEWVIAPQYDWASAFVNGKATVFEATEKDAHIYGVEPDRMEESPENNIYPILNVKGNWGVIDQQGKILIPLEYDAIENFFTPYPRVMKGQKFSYFVEKNHDFSLLTDSIEYDLAEPFTYGFGVLRKGEQMGVINSTGKWIIPLKYKYIVIQTPHIIKAQDEKDHNYYFDEQGKPILGNGITEEEVYTNNNNIMLFKKDGLWGITDSTGKMKTGFEFDSYDLKEMGNKIFLQVIKQYKCGILNSEAKEILPIQYDNVEYAYRSLYIVVQNKKYALYDAFQQKFLTNFDYEAMQRMQDGRFYAYKNGKLRYLNDRGKCIEGCE